MDIATLFDERSPWIFIIMTCVLGGGAAYMAGRGLALKWRPVWQAMAYMLIMGFALRFFHFALFQETLIAPWYYIVDTLVLEAATLIGYRTTRVNQMVNQYGWLYERTGAFGWRPRQAG